MNHKTPQEYLSTQETDIYQNSPILIQYEGLAGPSHHFGGLSLGNLASMQHKYQISQPKKAALENLDKMRQVHQLGAKVIIAPPHPRPFLPLMRQISNGSLTQMISQFSDDIGLLSILYSSAFMWSANAGTSIIDHNRITRFCPANFSKTNHRQIETAITRHYIKEQFNSPTMRLENPNPFILADEGAANHFCLYPSLDQINDALHVFVHGNHKRSSSFPRRQNPWANHYLSKTLQTRSELFLEQSSKAIDAGIFHNDVIVASESNILISHEDAFEDKNAFQLIQNTCQSKGFDIQICIAKSSEFPLEDVVKSYVYNGQIIQKGTQFFWLLPNHYLDIPTAKRFVEKVCQELPITAVPICLEGSMKNGGGPACCRLRIPLHSNTHINPNCIWSENLDHQLRQWINRYYPDQLQITDFKDPQFAEHCLNALNALAPILKIQIPYLN